MVTVGTLKWGKKFESFGENVKKAVCQILQDDLAFTE